MSNILSGVPVLEATKADGSAWRQANFLRACVLERVYKQSECQPHCLGHQLLGMRKLVRRWG